MPTVPESIGGPSADQEIAPGIPFSTVDRAPPDEPERLVPAWGVLHRCERSNLADPERVFEREQSHKDQSRSCSAALTLLPHIRMLDEALRAGIEQAALPTEVVQQLLTHRVWPSSAMVDISNSIDIVSPGPRDAMCIVTARAIRLAAARQACTGLERYEI